MSTHDEHEHELTAEEEEGIRLALEAANRGELFEHDDVRAELLAELEALTNVRRAG